MSLLVAEYPPYFSFHKVELKAVIITVEQYILTYCGNNKVRTCNNRYTYKMAIYFSSLFFLPNWLQTHKESR